MHRRGRTGLLRRMAEFAIQRGPTVLCSWDIPSGNFTFHEKAMQKQNRLVLGELERLSFSLVAPQVDSEFRIYIGDMPLSDLLPVGVEPGGMVIAGRRHWPESAYFESGRGETKVRLESRSEGTSSDAWSPVLEISVWVLPTKIGEAAYETMADDLQKISHSLLVDLFGKSTKTYDIRFSKRLGRFRSAVEELDAIAAITDRLVGLLTKISHRPCAKVVRRTIRRDYWGTEELRRRALVDLSRKGIDLRTASRPVRAVVQSQRVESFDIPEHRLVNFLLHSLDRRTLICSHAANHHIKTINAERPLRDTRFGSAPSLYETVDLPKTQRLQRAVVTGIRLRRLIRAMQELPFLKGVSESLVFPRGGMFQQTHEYRELHRLLLHVLIAEPMWRAGSEYAAVAKLTSRLFEQWCFLQIVNAFRKCGLDLRGWGDVVREEAQTKFIVDFDRGLQFQGLLAPGLMIRLRYEPWILGQKAAQAKGETLCRISSETVAWSPDIVVEYLTLEGANWFPAYAIVLDCKYTATIRDQHWNDARKYSQIRGTESKRQIVRQLWLISLGENRIESTDPAVEFTQNGPSCPSEESGYFSMGVRPGSTGESATAGETSNVFDSFAGGTINYIRRELI
jgi:hypothetical protein